MSIFEKIAENKIQEAIENGDFERLTNKGRPLCLDEYFATPEDFRLGQPGLENAQILPTEIDFATRSRATE
ncbi:MAG: DnaJ family domain-containing protein [Blastocatellia bacterium]